MTKIFSTNFDAKIVEVKAVREYLGKGTWVESKPGKNFSGVVMSLGTCKAGDTSVLTSTDYLQRMAELGFVRFDDLVPIVGKELVSEFVQIYNDGHIEDIVKKD